MRGSIASGLAERAFDLEDFAFLKKRLAGARVVGLGEATHGTKEFFQIRERLLRFLVEDMGFDTLAIETSHSAAQAINDYVSGGAGDRSSLLSGLGTVMWDVEEFAEVVDWMRAHNTSAAVARPVRFCGLDIMNTQRGRECILAYLRIVAPDIASGAQAAFLRVANAEHHGMLLAHLHLDRELFLDLRRLSELFDARRDSFVEATSPSAYAEVAEHLEVVLQSVAVHLTPELAGELPADVPHKSGCNNFARSGFMARNLIRRMEHDGPRTKVVIWAHNYHIGVGIDDPGLGTVPNMGQALRAKLGDEYHAFGLELHRGTYLSREWLPNRMPGDLKEGLVNAAPEGSLPWHLAQLDKPRLGIDLRAGAATGDLEAWLMTPQRMHCISWAHYPPLLMTVDLRRSFDALIFVKDTTATTPTANARATTARGLGH